MVNPADAIFVMHPTAEQPRDFLLQDDGRGAGSYLKEWNFQINGVPVPQPTPEELAAVTPEQVAEAKVAAARTAAAHAAIGSLTPEAAANRTDASMQWTELNNLKEVCRYLLDELQISREKFVGDINTRRGGVKFEQAPPDAGAMYDGLVRIPQSRIVGTLLSAISVGLGDPIKT